MDVCWWLPSRSLPVSRSMKPSAARKKCKRLFKRRSIRQFKKRLRSRQRWESCHDLLSNARGSIPSGSHPGRTIARGKKGQGPQRANGGRRAASRCVPNVGRPMPGFVFWGGGGRVCARGFLDKNDDGSISSTGRSDLYRARADLLKSKILVEENGQIWRAKY